MDMQKAMGGPNRYASALSTLAISGSIKRKSTIPGLGETMIITAIVVIQMTQLLITTQYGNMTLCN